MSTLVGLIDAALNSTDPCSSPAMAAGLAKVEHRRMKSGHAPDASYQSSWFLDGEFAERELGRLSHGGGAIRVTRFEPNLPRQYALLGMTQSELGPALILEVLRAGLRFLDPVPTAAACVASLVRVIHPLALNDPEWDVSYSDPTVPLSIFIGVPSTSERHCAARIAEGILHEAMHLQLSLIEQVRPLVRAADTALFSPWRESQRPVGGILHGLYVFRAIQHFMQKVAESAPLTADERVHCRSRVRAIEQEIQQVEDLRDHPALTEAGKVLAQSLLDCAVPVNRALN